MTIDGFRSFLPEDLETTVVIEASDTLDRAASILEGYRVKVAHPVKLKLISMSTKKIDRNDCRKLLDLNRANAWKRHSNFCHFAGVKFTKKAANIEQKWPIAAIEFQKRISWAPLP